MNITKSYRIKGFWRKPIGFSILIISGTFAYPAFAIPSPELVIGSVSSLTQLFAVGFAVVSGAIATFGAKFGLKRKQGAVQSKLLINVLVVLALLLTASIGYIIYQKNQTDLNEQARLQSTLTRPASFSGTKILDENLKETSLSAQKVSALSISTADAEKLLNAKSDTGETILLDIREDAEFAMGTMPGARHIRFPDIATSGLNLMGKKVLLMCHNGNRSSETCTRLAAMGIDCRFIAGGLEKWIVEGRKFTDSTVRGLSDLRAIPEYDNKNTLISTKRFEMLTTDADIQIIDTRYPKDFAVNHLPNAINIPIRAMPTADLNNALSNLQNKPTLVACYDRRSCFMGQVLGLEITKHGIDYLGRYTTPWDYFITPPLKPHIQKWLANQNKTLWGRAIDILAGLLIIVAEKSHFIVGIVLLSLISRLVVLPITLKSEKDQIVLAAHKDKMNTLKKQLKHDPTRQANAVQSLHKELGLTPLRNLTALLFLPVMMLGLSAIGKAAPEISDSFLWVATLGAPDPFYLFPVTFCIFAGIYLQMALANTRMRRIISWGLVVPLLFAMVFRLTAAGTIYLNFSLILLLIQRMYVTGILGQINNTIHQSIERWKIRNIYNGIIPLDYTQALKNCGNKSYRLAILKNAGFDVPQGAVVGSDVLKNYATMSDDGKSNFFDLLWLMVGQQTCVVRSSGSDEDGSDQSFAGVFDSVLDVDRAGLQGAFERVLKSFQSHRAGFYQSANGKGHRGNILIQQMVDAQYSGVLFTQDPMAPGQVLLEMAKGTADDLVSGRITPLSLRYGKYTHLSCDDTDAPINVNELLKTGQSIEKLFGRPQDIEWAYRDGKFFFVQSRDITTLNLGSDTEQARQKEWSKFFSIYGSSSLNGPVLKQDEMSEVLPRPTPLSFSIMSSLWAQGGSVGLACRALGLTYKMPENKNGHLFQLFGKVYSDVAVKSSAALFLPRTVERNLEKRCMSVENNFHQEFIPALHKKLAYWNAVDFSKLNLENQLDCVEQLTRLFVDEVYVIAEQVNILASFLSLTAEAECKRFGLNPLQIMQSPMTHSPNSMMAKASNLPVEQGKEYLLQTMGHRALFDYELSMPRYSETPETLWKLSTGSVYPLHKPQKDKAEQDASNFPDIIKVTLRFHDLKEHAKHESLRVFAILRRVLLEIDRNFSGDGLVFYLTYEELIGCVENNLSMLNEIAKARSETSKSIKPFAPSKAILTMHDCELLSGLAPNSVPQTGDMQGTCVSGEVDVTGKVYLAFTAEETGQEDLIDFNAGDILVCRMMNPAWLPYVLQSKAVICEVGGWLSHMAIVAREHNIPMVVGCTGLEGLQSGDEITVSKSGAIALNADETDSRSANAVAV
jgi:rhodanese-related sulfurtransferase/membrane protein insertase Oxa1/YidC/SpoIIIJ/phosphohistidine swiveling domain-containing protein